MSTPDRLRWAADVLDGLPGLPPVHVTVTAGFVRFLVGGADDHALRAAVDAITAIIGAAPAVEREFYMGSLDYGTPYNTGDVSVFAVLSARAAADYADRQQVTA